MKLLQINIDHKMTPEQFAAGAEDTRKFAETISKVPGLMWKIWIGADERPEVGGIYMFTDEAAAKAFMAGPLYAAIKGNPGFTKVEGKLFNVDEMHSAITNAPLPAATKA